MTTPHTSPFQLKPEKNEERKQRSNREEEMRKNGGGTNEQITHKDRTKTPQRKRKTSYQHDELPLYNPPFRSKADQN